ncbi:MAG: glucokinase [Gammaproteobacteria bacterium]|nr:glucokinase [Gammaproteobacteria bacterium]NNC97592.1 glucokinase [Gammaproteobacteria bacterium]NNM14791.1 glucokinase [Gammaproteobacteria bacterium]
MLSIQGNNIPDTAIKIVGDIGGTNARFACVTDEGNFYHKVKIYPCADFPNIDDALEMYIDHLRSLSVDGIVNLQEVCLAIAGPVYHDIIDLPNNHWVFSRTKLQRVIGVPVQVINDFTAQTLSLDLLAEDELIWFDDMRPSPRGIRTVIGPGTGLGIAIQTPNGEIIPSEAGHIAFAPRNKHQVDILNLLWQRYSRVSVERILSGGGIENLYWANSSLDGREKNIDASDIIGLVNRNDPIAEKTLDDFFRILACFCGDMAMTAWSTGGVYLSGGILPKLQEFLDMKTFRERFQDKGRFTEFCRTVPIALVKAEQPGLLGCVAAVQKNQES